MLPTPGRMMSRLVGLAALFPGSRSLAAYNMTYRAADEAHRVEAVSGSFLMIRRETMERVGLLDETFFMYGEDLDWCCRVLKDGWEIQYYPKARVKHYLGQSSRQNRRRTIRALHHAGAVYYKKHLAAENPKPVNWLVFGGLRLRCAAALMFSALGGRTKPAGRGSALREAAAARGDLGN